MTNGIPEYIDIGQHPHVEKFYRSGKDICIDLKNPTNAKIIATIKPEYTPFRKEIERLLKEKGLDKKATKDILHLVDNSHDIIYKDNTSTTSKGNKKEHGSDQSDQSDHDKNEELQIVNVSQCIKLHDGKVQTAGNIVGINEPFKMISSVKKSCGCGEDVEEIFDPPLYNMSESENGICSECNVKIHRTKDSIKYKNAITVYLQDNEKFNDIEKIMCILLDIDAETIRIGERVNITGRIHIRPKSNQIYLIPKVFAEELEYANKEQITLSDRDIEAIRRFAKLKGSSVIETLIDLFDKSIIGNNMVKESLLYCLVSAGNDLEEIKKHKTRNRINVLLAGNPGLGKSSLLKKAVSLIPDSRYESVQHSSAKSLTAIVSKEEEQHSLRLGPIPVATGSVCGLNELGTMSFDEQNHLLDIMEEGEFTINKHGFNSKILSPTTIIASTNLGNPNTFGNRFGGVDMIGGNQSPFYPLPLQNQLLDRFDLILILKDNGDLEALKEYTERKTELQSSIIPNYDVFLQKYIEYSRKIKPILSPEASKMIQQYYIDLSKSNRNPESKRRLETITRLCKAVSKLKLKEIVEPEDVSHATGFYNNVIYNYLESKAPIPKDPVKLTIEKCITILRESKDTPILFSDLIIQVCNGSEYIKSYLLGSASMDIDGNKLSLDRNKKVRRISQLLCSDKSIAVVNKSPKKLQYKEDIEESNQKEGQNGQNGQTQFMEIKLKK